MLPLVPTRERFPATFTRLESELENLAQRFDRMFGDAGDWWLPSNRIMPPVDLVETDQMYEIRVELPGIKLEDVNVEFKGGDLYITGEKVKEKEEKGKHFHRLECRYGEFRRRIELPGAIDEKKIEAKFVDGMLHVMIPKSEEVKPKKIEIKS